MMDLQKFLNAFAQIANAPGGIDQLRSMIYQLAVTGALTSRLENDQSAADLLKDVGVKRRNLIEAKHYKRMAELEAEPVAAPTGIHIPESWAWSRLLDLGEINPKNSATDDDVAAFLPMRGVPTAYRGSVVFESGKWGELKKGYTHFAAGDVVLAKITPCFENGKAAVIPVLKEGAKVGGGTTELLVFRPIHQGINADYVYLFLRSLTFAVEGEARMTGTAGQKRLPTEYFATRAFPLPPSLEQARIVDKVDELMALCSQLENQQKARRTLQVKARKALIQATANVTVSKDVASGWSKLTNHFAELFSTTGDVQDLRGLVCDLAIRGMLFVESSEGSVEEVDGLLRDIASRKSGKRFAKSTKPEKEFDLPRGWTWVLMEDLLQGSESGWSPKCDAEARRDGEYGVLKVSAVTWGKFRPDENKRLPPSLTPRLECEVMPADFLITRANTAELVARSVIVPDDCPPRLMMSDKIIRLNFINDDLKGWVNLVNNSDMSRSYYKLKATGTSDSMRNVSREAIHELPIPLPPLKVQKEIMQTVSLVLARCEELITMFQEKDKIGISLSKAVISNITGVAATEGEDKLKVPQTELIAPLRIGIPPSVTSQAPLASILARHSNALNAKGLWQRFGGEIDRFYAQLKHEVSQGWIVEPEIAEMREREGA